MTDPTNNAPIRIPIESDDDLANPPDEFDDDDVIEIDGDAVDFDADLIAEDGDEPAPGDDVDAEPEAEVAEAPVEAPAEAEVEAAPEAPAEVEAAPEAAAEAPVEAPAETADEADAPFDEEVVAEAEAAPKTSEISREAVYEMMQELRQKTEQITRITDEKNDLYDRLLRRQAEFENFRKRGEREMQEAYIRARADVLLDMLPIIDNFDLALHHAENASADVIHEGVQLIYKQLLDTLGRLGLEPIDAEGKPFDPELHDAVATETTEDVPDQTVLSVLQRGFKLGDRMLRHARVKVAVQP